MNRFRKFTALAPVLIAALVLTACGGGSSDSGSTSAAGSTAAASTAAGGNGGTSAAETGSETQSAEETQGGSESASYADTITIGVTAEPTFLEPNCQGAGPTEIQLTQQIYEGLVSTDTDGSIVACLASDWTMSDDGLTYTFNLVPGVKFSDGRDVKPEDWVWSLLRARDSETSNYTYIAEPIESVEATDTQVIIHLTGPTPSFLAQLGCFNMVLGCKEYAESFASDEEYMRNPMGTGPYMLKEWNLGSDLTMVANPYYREEGMPKTPNLHYVVVADDNTRLMQLQTNQIDVATSFPFSLTQAIENDPALELGVFPSTQIYYLILNTTLEPFDDPAVRQAMYYALDTAELASAIAGDFGAPVGSIVSATQNEYCNTDIKPTAYDPEQAKKILSDAGYTDPVDFTITVRTGSAFYEQITTLIKNEVDQAGFNCTIELLESAATSDKFQNLQHQATVLQWVDDYQDPSGVVGWSVDYDQCQGWYTGLNDVELNDLFVEAQAEMDQQKRIEMYWEMQQRVHDNANIIPLYRNDTASAYSANVDGVYVSPFYVYYAKNWTKTN